MSFGVDHSMQSNCSERAVIKYVARAIPGAAQPTSTDAAPIASQPAGEPLAPTVVAGSGAEEQVLPVIPMAGSQETNSVPNLFNYECHSYGSTVPTDKRRPRRCANFTKKTALGTARRLCDPSPGRVDVLRRGSL